MNRLPFLMGLGAALLTGCQNLSHYRVYSIVGDNDEPLRRIFNKDVGKVRVLMLVSPT